jgi:hydrogenase nickel incorporation protein HypB
MCDTCGCNSDHDHFTLNRPGDGEHHVHEHIHPHDHSHGPNPSLKQISVETDILAKNNLLAERNRGFFEAKHIRAFNFVSSPGSGKTTLLEKLIAALKDKKPIYVIEGDQQTSEDADRIKAAGAEAIQINTGNGCHLDAHMINHALKALDPKEHSLVFIENVGNLVCPALFDLGEQIRIVVASTTEGEDKPLKYPTMFQSAHLCILNKTDLLPYLDFSVDKFRFNLDIVKPEQEFMALSAKTGEGLKNLLSIF